MRKKRNSNKKITAKIVGINLAFLILSQIIVGICFSIPMVYYGPFIRLREILVTSAMTTMNHQYIVEKFISAAEINRIMEKYKFDDNKNSDEDSIEVMAPVKKLEEVNLDPTHGINIENIQGPTYKGFVVTIDDPKRIKVGTTNKLGSEGIKLEELVKNRGAILGINAGGFVDPEGKGNGGQPLGLIIEDGKVINGNNNETYSLIGFDESGVLVLGKYNLAQIKKKNIKEAVSFYPFLVVDGEPMIKQGDGGWGIAARTAIGQRRDGTIVMIIINGRQVDSPGATIKEVQNIMVEYDVYNGANLDGGSSTMLVFDSKIYNKPASPYGFRPLPSAFIVK